MPVFWHTAPQPSGACLAYHELLAYSLNSWLSGFVLATATPTVKLAFHPYVVVNSLMTCALRLTTRLSWWSCLRLPSLWLSQRHWLLRQSLPHQACG
ncbi:hypothetical protein AVDCRST_MAG94-1195 [uncultured Leptolyngbya sp.]|uniref:Uncharacterized protein n=1 Tax=uncultured Leptolyngbya sp. TaxID=332963 RepID=A0A6J4KV72_9CYAN|nr:hypothetical protein AVDCRST_MAG94-1195 [uncultured Leptolyngbya sp.]